MHGHLSRSPCTDPLGMLHLFLKGTANVLTPRLFVVFRTHLHVGSLPACWRRLMSPQFGRFSFLLSGRVRCLFVFGDLWNAEVCFQPPCSFIGNFLALAMTFCVWLTLAEHVGEGQEIRVVQIDFSAALSGSTIRRFSSSSAPLALDVLCSGHNMSC